MGTALLQKEYRQQNKRLHEKSLIKVINAFGLSDLDELLIEIGKGNIKAREVLSFLYPNKSNDPQIIPLLPKPHSQEKMKIKGVDSGYGHTLCSLLSSITW